MRCVGVLFCVWFGLSVVSVSVSGQDNQLNVGVDRISARSVRIQWLNSVATSSYTQTLIQYSNVTEQITGASSTRTSFHNNVPSPGVEISLPQSGIIPVSSHILRNLNPSSNYAVRVAYIDTVGVVQGSASHSIFTTPALSSTAGLSSLLGSGGCGQLTSAGTRYYLQLTTDGSGAQVYTCDVAADITNITIQIVPQHAYATIPTASEPLSTSNVTLSTTATSSFADPLTRYSTNLVLGAPGTVTNFTWTVQAEAGNTQVYVLSVLRPLLATTVSVDGPTSPVVAVFKSPPVATTYTYRGLVWQSSTVGKWKVWSDDLVTFPFSSLANASMGMSPIATLSVTPAAPSSPEGSCSNVYVALYDQTGASSPIFTTCIQSLTDTCSSLPYGSVTTWHQTYNADSTPKDAATFVYPPPPTPTFPDA